jgi:hypothetical protein
MGRAVGNHGAVRWSLDGPVAKAQRTLDRLRRCTGKRLQVAESTSSTKVL